MIAIPQQLYCAKCRKTLADTNFYTMPSGKKSDLCKACETMHINNYQEDTFLWLLEKYNVAWLPWEWNAIADKQYQKDPYKFNGMSVFGRYLAKMKLKQHQGETWDRSEELQIKHEEEAKLHGTAQEQTMRKIEDIKAAYENGEITEAQYLTYKEQNEPIQPEIIDIGGAVTTAGPGNNPYPVNDNPFEQIDLPDVGADLTPEDKIYLANKWGRLYPAADWVYLESKYKDFTDSFDIQGAARIDTLIQICKLSLKMNQALDCGDMDSYSKLVRAYDSLMKSAKFTEAQKKEDQSGEFSCYGQIVAYAELKQGGIERMPLNVDRDVVDADIRDIKAYNRSLIDEDPAIFKLIEQYIKKRESAEQQEADLEEAKERGEDFVALTDEDFAEFNKKMELKDEDEEEDE